MKIDMSEISALVLGGGKGTRLFPLTKERAKPAVPLAGQFRLIDIPLSNCINSGINKVYVITQFLSHSLHKHVHTSYKFDMFNKGMIDILAASQSMDNTGWFQGTADAVRQNVDTVFGDNYSGRTLILSGDQIYRMDFRDLVENHIFTCSDVSIAVTFKPVREAHQFGCMRVDDNFRIIEFIEKPDSEEVKKIILGADKLKAMGIDTKEDLVLVSMGIYLFDTDKLIKSLDNDMEDFGKNIIPWAIKNFKVSAYLFSGYWEDIGTIGAFFDANLRLAEMLPPFDFYVEKAPIYTKSRFLPCSKINGSCFVKQSTIADGAILENCNISHCVVGIRSVIREGCSLEDVIVMGQDDYRIEENVSVKRGIGRHCRIKRAIIDKNTSIGDHVIIESHEGRTDFNGEYYYVRDGIVIIPKNAVIPAGTVIS